MDWENIIFKGVNGISEFQSNHDPYSEGRFVHRYSSIFWANIEVGCFLSNNWFHLRLETIRLPLAWNSLILSAKHWNFKFSISVTFGVSFQTLWKYSIQNFPESPAQVLPARDPSPAQSWPFKLKYPIKVRFRFLMK